MFKKIAEIKTLPGGFTEDDIFAAYGHDPDWARLTKDPRWSEYLALCMTDQRDGTTTAKDYKG